MIFRKIYSGQIFPIQVVLQSEVFDSAAVKKSLARFRVPMAKISRFYYRHKINIGGPRCRGSQGTLMNWLCTIINSNSSTQSTLPPYAPLLSQVTHLRIQVGWDIFIRTARFERYECCSLAYSEWFLEKSTGVKSFQFRLFCRVRPLILQPWKKA